MKRLLLPLLFLVAPILYGQSMTPIFTGTMANGTTTTQNSTLILGFDTLKVIMQGGELSTDSVRGAVYLQVQVLSRWSTGILLDSLVAKGGTDIRTRSTSLAGLPLTADSVKAQWFSGTSVTGEYKNAILARTDWAYRLYVVGHALAPPLSGNYPITGAPVKIYSLEW